MTTDAALVPTSRRIESLDFVRGCALCGILILNIVGMAMAPAYENPRAMGGDTGANLWAWIITTVGFEGTQRALFSILFGAGVILLTGRLEKSDRADASDIYFRRQLWLIAFGLVNAWVLLWFGDILYMYGITALFLYAFRNLPGRTLLALGVGAFLLGAAWNVLDASNTLQSYRSYESASAIPAGQRSAAQKEAIGAWQGKEREFAPPPNVIADMRKAETASYWSALKQRSGIIVHFQTWFTYRYFFDIFGMMLVGMALFRLGVLTLDVRAHVYWAMVIGGYAVGLTTNIAEVRWILAQDFSLLAHKQAAISYDLGRLAMTAGHLGLLMLFLRAGILGWLRRAMAAVGRMALTNYLAHSIVALAVFNLLGFWGALERYQLYFVVLAIWVAQLLYSPVWLRYFHFGPVEWLWRYLTYGHAPPFRRRVELIPSAGAPAAAE